MSRATHSNKLEDQAAATALSSNKGQRRPSVLDEDGKLSSASAATSLKYAQAQDLPSFPSAGLKMSSAGAAASLADSNKKTFEHWKPGAIPAANKAAMLAKDYEMDPLWQPELSAAGSKAAVLAHRDTTSADVWRSQGTEQGHSAAGQAVKSKPPNAIHDREMPADSRQKALMAATGAMSGSRPRAGSVPSGKVDNTNWALKAATQSQKGASNSGQFTTGDPGFEAARIQNIAKNNVNRQMYGSSPPVSIEVEEKNRQDTLRASAVAMAQKMYAIQQKHIDEAAGVQRNDGRAAARSSHQRNLSSDSSEGGDENLGARGHQYENLEEAARKLAQERLSKMHDEHAEYRKYYGASTSNTRSRLSNRFRRRGSTGSRDDSSDDEERSHRIKKQMSMFQSNLATVDDKKRQADREALLVAAHRNVEARMAKMDEQVFQDTGKASPAQKELWERQAREKAQQASDVRMQNVGKVHIGGGKYMDQADIDAIAKARLQPTLDEINDTAEKQRARDEEIRLERQRAEELAAKEKQRAAEVKSEMKLAQETEKAELKAKKAEEKKVASEQAAVEKERAKKEKEEAKKEKEEKRYQANLEKDQLRAKAEEEKKAANELAVAEKERLKKEKEEERFKANLEKDQLKAQAEEEQKAADDLAAAEKERLRKEKEEKRYMEHLEEDQARAEKEEERRVANELAAAEKERIKKEKEEAKFVAHLEEDQAHTQTEEERKAANELAAAEKERLRKEKEEQRYLAHLEEDQVRSEAEEERKAADKLAKAEKERLKKEKEEKRFVAHLEEDQLRTETEEERKVANELAAAEKEGVKKEKERKTSDAKPGRFNSIFKRKNKDAAAMEGDSTTGTNNTASAARDVLVRTEAGDSVHDQVTMPAASIPSSIGATKITSHAERPTAATTASTTLATPATLTTDKTSPAEETVASPSRRESKVKSWFKSHMKTPNKSEKDESGKSSTVVASEGAEKARDGSIRDVAMAGRETEDMYGTSSKGERPVSPIRDTDATRASRTSSVSSYSSHEAVIADARPLSGNEHVAQVGQSGLKAKLMKKIKPTKSEADDPNKKSFVTATTDDEDDEFEEARDKFEENKLAPPPVVTTTNTMPASPRSSHEHSKFKEEL